MQAVAQVHLEVGLEGAVSAGAAVVVAGVGRAVIGRARDIRRLAVDAGNTGIKHALIGQVLGAQVEGHVIVETQGGSQRQAVLLVPDLVAVRVALIGHGIDAHLYRFVQRLVDVEGQAPGVVGTQAGGQVSLRL